MIVKIKKHNKGWTYYSDVLKVETDFTYCFHFTDDERLTAVLYNKIESGEKAGELKKNVSSIHVLNDCIYELSEEDIYKYQTEDVYIMKILRIYQQDGLISSIGMQQTNDVFLLNDKGETVERL